MKTLNTFELIKESEKLGLQIEGINDNFCKLLDKLSCNSVRIGNVYYSVYNKLAATGQIDEDLSDDYINEYEANVDISDISSIFEDKGSCEYKILKKHDFPWKEPVFVSNVYDYYVVPLSWLEAKNKKELTKAIKRSLLTAFPMSKEIKELKKLNEMNSVSQTIIKLNESVCHNLKRIEELRKLQCESK